MNFDLRVPIVIAATSLIAGCAGYQGPKLIVDLSQVASECSVRGVAVRCDDVPNYLRETLKLPLDTYIAVRSPEAGTTFEAMDTVMKALDKAGYRSVIGLIELEGAAQPK